MKAVKLSVLRLARTAGLFRLFRWLSRSKVRILCYHGGNVGDERRFNSLLFCQAGLLEARLQWLQDKGFSIIPLDAAVTMLGNDRPRPRLPTVLTFDDGWYSTFRGLHPVLERRQLPATLYLCTGYFVAGRPNLDVTLSYILWKAGRAQVNIQGFDAGVDGAHDLSTSAGKKRLAGAMLRWLEQNGASRAGVCADLERFAAQLGVSAAELDLASRRFDFVRPDELLQMASQGWSIELHGHVHQYPVGRPDELKADLARCQAEIGKVGLPMARHYCYPSGDHDADAHQLLRNLGVVSATTCIPGLLERADERQKFYLSRFLDGENIHPLEFESEMSGFADFLRRLAGRG